MKTQISHAILLRFLVILLCSLLVRPSPAFAGISGRAAEPLEHKPAGPVYADITAGRFHTCAILASGGVQCWGANSVGQLGNGATISRGAPADVVGLPGKAVAVDVGVYSTCALLATGGMLCWGWNSTGQLGSGSWMENSSTPVGVAGLSSGVAAIAVGAFHACALLTTGGVKCWGDDYYGQLGIVPWGDTNSPIKVAGLSSGVKAIAAGDNHTCALLVGGGVKCWGMTFGMEPSDVAGLSSGVEAIAAGGISTCVLLADGSVKCWTVYDDGPIEVLGFSGAVKKVSIGLGHICALLESGGVQCWGENGAGQLGNGSMTGSSAPADVVGLTGAADGGVIAIAAGDKHTCAVLATGAGLCWGRNQYGQLGDGDPPFYAVAQDVIGLNGVAATQGQYGSACALASSGDAQCWGSMALFSAESGWLGSGVPQKVVGLSNAVSAIVTGKGHRCALLTSGGVQCWGANKYGQLGDNTKTDRSAPVNVFGLSSGVKAVVTGDEHTCALMHSGGIKCWGKNADGQLGTSQAWGEDTPADVYELTSGVAAIAAGARHTCALMVNGGVKCWGFNFYGQLGDGTNTTYRARRDVIGLSGSVAAIAAGERHTCALLESGGVQCWGANNPDGDLGPSTETRSNTAVDVVGLSGPAMAIAADYRHTCILLTSGGVQCWGRNAEGQLGNGAASSSGLPVDVAGLSHGVTALAPGANCVLVGAGRPKCWGPDDNGQVGVGRAVLRLVPAPVSAPFVPALKINYPDGRPGSFFTITGANFPPGQAVVLSVNGETLASFTVNPTGGFIFFLDTAGSAPGNYEATVTGGAFAGFILDDAAPLRSQEGGGTVYPLQADGAFVYLYLPMTR